MFVMNESRCWFAFLLLITSMLTVVSQQTLRSSNSVSSVLYANDSYHIKRFDAISRGIGLSEISVTDDILATSSGLSPAALALIALSDSPSIRRLRTPSLKRSNATHLNYTWPLKRVAQMHGDIILGGLMMVHERDDRLICGKIMPQGGIQALECMLFTIDYINKHQILPGIKIGAYVLDDCDKDTYGLEQAVDFIKGNDNIFFYSSLPLLSFLFDANNWHTFISLKHFRNNPIHLAFFTSAQQAVESAYIQSVIKRNLLFDSTACRCVDFFNYILEC